MKIEHVAYLQPVPRNIPTGRNAQRSLSDRWAAFQKAPVKDEEASFPVNARAQRRAEKAADQRSRKKGQRNYVRRELAREAEANQLATLFNQIDGFTRVSEQAVARAHQAIEARVDQWIAGKDVADEEIEQARQEALQLLRGIAKTAPVPFRGSARTKALRVERAARQRAAEAEAFAALGDPHSQGRIA